MNKVASPFRVRTARLVGGAIRSTVCSEIETRPTIAKLALVLTAIIFDQVSLKIFESLSETVS